jgi:predicted phage terminase large subunit-like protein
VKPGRKHVEAELCRRDLREFVRQGWEHVEPGVPYLHNWHVDAIAWHLEALYHGDIRRLAITVPPRCGKSSLAGVLGPAYWWLQDPTFKWITASYERQLAVRDSLRMRRLLDTDWYRALNRRPDGAPIFRLAANELGLERLSDREEFYENDLGGNRYAVGVLGALTGRGGSIVQVDDPINPQGVASDADRLRMLEWWDQTASTRLDDAKTGRKLIVCQRLHHDDLIGHELSKNLDYVHLKLPMELYARSRCVTVLGPELTWEDDRTEDGELLWPAKFGPEQVAEFKRDLGSWAYSAQYQQEPVPLGSGLLKVEKLRRWTAWPQFDRIALSLDAAFSDAATSSYVVATVWASSGEDDYLLDMVRAHLDFKGTLDAVRGLAAKWRPGAFLVELKANGHAIVNALAGELSPIIPIVPRESKEARAAAVAPRIEAGNVWIPDDATGCTWVSDVIAELGAFPRGKYDDIVDSCTQYLSWRRLDPAQVASASRSARMRQWASVDFTALRNPQVGYGSERFLSWALRNSRYR